MWRTVIWPSGSAAISTTVLCSVLFNVWGKKCFLFEGELRRTGQVWAELRKTDLPCFALVLNWPALTVFSTSFVDSFLPAFQIPGPARFWRPAPVSIWSHGIPIPVLSSTLIWLTRRSVWFASNGACEEAALIKPKRQHATQYALQILNETN